MSIIQQSTTTTISEAFNNATESFIEQLPQITMGVLIIVLGVLIAGWIGRFARKRISARTDDPLMSKFLGTAIKYLIIIITIMLALRAAGLAGVATGILTAAGASAVVLGFAFKDIGENFIAGIILAFNRPFDVDDTVMVGSNFGKVKTLDLRYTKLKTFDGKDVYIPNSDVLTEPVTNYTEDGFYRWDFVIGIAYEDNIEGAKETVLRALADEPNVINDEIHENFVIEDELATSTVNLKVFFWVDTKDFRKQAMITKGNVVRKVKEALENDGYYMPADIQEIKLYGGVKEFPLSFNKNTNYFKNR
ncbi:mechanosensitive ion channel family protein [Dokdonia donghaensis]|uniref:Mechanosensitive ion channel protein MscS n=1 Tax=Dokdonia donghaensis DSW-1 TaxID=1300343 RepID=A0A0A2GZU8_9FLAO|nr:mechanosensitive ion channel domain-containing protein [Dokdonia donghaensis]ANH60804.1 Small-conductance mechanosensitive channel [Dokdonia donghaensis DSW-1]KGO05935.1 mechanosensitive ion channel protein MscS [Dokdonia donghaensis DSW-1]